jgi:hypothetical protein
MLSGYTRERIGCALILAVELSATMLSGPSAPVLRPKMI